MPTSPRSRSCSGCGSGGMPRTGRKLGNGQSSNNSSAEHSTRPWQRVQARRRRRRQRPVRRRRQWRAKAWGVTGVGFTACAVHAYASSACFVLALTAPILSRHHHEDNRGVSPNMLISLLGPWFSRISNTTAFAAPSRAECLLFCLLVGSQPTVVSVVGSRRWWLAMLHAKVARAIACATNRCRWLNL